MQDVTQKFANLAISPKVVGDEAPTKIAEDWAKDNKLCHFKTARDPVHEIPCICIHNRSLVCFEVLADVPCRSRISYAVIYMRRSSDGVLLHSFYPSNPVYLLACLRAFRICLDQATETAFYHAYCGATLPCNKQ
jgi:hypothetical protein